MTYKLKILSDIELCLVAYSGRVQAKEFDEVWESISSAPDYVLHFDDVVLLGPTADYSDLPYDAAHTQALRLVEMFQTAKVNRAKRCAFLCSNEMQAVMGRMYGAYISSLSVPMEIATFTVFDPMVEWVESNPRAPRVLDRARIAEALLQMGEDWCLKGRAAA